jgi:hypothetical protein
MRSSTVSPEEGVKMTALGTITAVAGRGATRRTAAPAGEAAKRAPRMQAAVIAVNPTTRTLTRAGVGTTTPLTIRTPEGRGKAGPTRRPATTVKADPLAPKTTGAGEETAVTMPVTGEAMPGRRMLQTAVSPVFWTTIPATRPGPYRPMSSRMRLIRCGRWRAR